MKKLGCGIALIGLLMLVGSFALFGSTIFFVFVLESNRVASVPLEMGVEKTSGVFEVGTERFSQIGVTMTVRSQSIQEEEKFDEPEFKARYEFPFRYTVRDAQGNEIISQETELNWDSGFRFFSGQQVTAKEGTLTVEHYLEKFEVPPPGKIRIEAEIQPDSLYEAEARDVQVNLYNNVSKHSQTMIGAFSMVCLGPVLMVAGLIVFLVGLGSRSQVDSYS